MVRSLSLLTAAVAACLFFSAAVSAEIVTRDVEYTDGDMTFQGYLAYDDANTGAVPGVAIVHQWKGLGDSEKRRARMLAELGYVAFAVDVYGKGVRPATSQEASAEAGKYYQDRNLLRQRVTLGVEQLKEFDGVDTERIAAIGYCFGGGGVLELARSGYDVDGVVSFHGTLKTPTPGDAQNITASVLVCHGADDPHAPMEDVIALNEEMDAAEVDYYIMLFGNAVHSFTHPEAGDDPSNGSAYNAEADWRSWEAMKDFFTQIFKK